MLNKQQNKNIEKVDAYIQDVFSQDTSGHDHGHILRVVKLTKELHTNENLYVAILTAYFHDILDEKLFDIDNEEEHFRKIWNSLDLDEESFSEVLSNIQSVGFKGGYINYDKSAEAILVSDADLLDATGAIGIARTFYYAGHKDLPLYDYTLEGLQAENYEDYRKLIRNSTAHFHEKLFKILDSVQTEKGKQIAQRRHDVLVEYYESLMDELKLD